MIPLKASDSIGPAFEHVKRQLFRPFRFAFWLRLALLGLATGELGGFNFNLNLPGRSQPTPSSPGTAAVPWHFPALAPAQIAAIIACVVVLGLALAILLLYVSSMLRFVLFESILTGDARIIAGWKKWRATGRRYFVWQLMMMAIAIAGAVILLGLPILGFVMKGAFHARPFNPALLAVLIPAFLAFFLFMIAVAVVTVLAKDFMVPMMALEGLGWRDGWVRVWTMLRNTPGEYAFYLILKIVLRIAAMILYMIVFVIVALVIAVPAAIVGFVGAAIAANAALVVKALLITIGIVGAIFLLLLAIALSAFIGAPIAYFFPSYSVFFFGSRYEPLRRIVYPEPPPAPPEAPPAPALA